MSEWKSAFSDIFKGTVAWRIWGVLAYEDVRQRYKRSILGEFWVSISLAVSVAVISSVYGGILNYISNMDVYVPYLAAGFAVWAMLSSNISEGSQAFISSYLYIGNLPLPKSVFVYRVLMRNLIVFCHNLVVVLAVLLLFGSWPGNVIFLLIPNLIIFLANSFWMVFFLAILSLRFRDLPPVISNILQLLFLITPILWFPKNLPVDMSLVVDLNIFASMIALLRDPILGVVPSTSVYIISITLAVMGLGLTFWLFAATRRKIVFWL